MSNFSLGNLCASRLVDQLSKVKRKFRRRSRKKAHDSQAHGI